MWVCVCGIVMVWAIPHFEQFHFANSKIWYKCTRSTIVFPYIGPLPQIKIWCYACERACVCYTSIIRNELFSFYFFFSGLFSSSEFGCLTVHLCRSFGCCCCCFPSSSSSLSSLSLSFYHQKIKSFFTSISFSFRFILCVHATQLYFVHSIHRITLSIFGAASCHSYIKMRHKHGHAHAHRECERAEEQ